jgi:hypothetical protein
MGSGVFPSIELDHNSERDNGPGFCQTRLSGGTMQVGGSVPNSRRLLHPARASVVGPNFFSAKRPSAFNGHCGFGKPAPNLPPE